MVRYKHESFDFNEVKISNCRVKITQTTEKHVTRWNRIITLESNWHIVRRIQTSTTICAKRRSRRSPTSSPTPTTCANSSSPKCGTRRLRRRLGPSQSHPQKSQNQSKTGQRCRSVQQAKVESIHSIGNTLEQRLQRNGLNLLASKLTSLCNRPV